LPTAQLEERLENLPPRSIVYYLAVSRDGNGQIAHPLHYVDRVVATASAPTYGWVNSMLGRGIVGGELKDQEAELATLARLALRVLKGEHPDTIPIAEVDLTERIVDARQLQKWRISETRVPADTRNLFREPGFWERYRTYALGMTLALIAQAVLIGGLLVQARRRRQAESQMKSSQTELRRSYERIRDLGGRLIDAQEAERSRIARELHDDVGQQVSLMAIDLDLLDASELRGPSRSGPRLSDIAERAHDIARSVHDLSHKLHPAKLQLMGLVPALESLRRDFSHSRVSIAFAHDDVPASLPNNITVCLFRSVQEALQNAVKHSGAREVRIQIGVGANAVILSVADDGVGFDVDAVWGRGLGLVSIAERLESVGGSLRVHSTAGIGTRLEMTVPYRTDSLSHTVAS
jgi:signal transduction histidine kinase